MVTRFAFFDDEHHRTDMGEKRRTGAGRVGRPRGRQDNIGMETILVDMAGLVDGLSKGATDHPIIYPFYLVLANSRRT